MASAFNNSKPRAETSFLADYKELLTVRDQLFVLHNSSCTLNRPEMLQAAVQTIELWRERAPLPHALNATAQLVKATLTDASPDASVAIYGQAMANFVTGYTDTQQNLRRKMSMFEVGRNIGLPGRYISARHSIVHGDMPSLIELRRLTLGALKWLWEDYWSFIGKQPPPTNVVHQANKSEMELYDNSEPEKVSGDATTKMNNVIQKYQARIDGSGSKSDRDAKTGILHVHPNAISHKAAAQLGEMMERETNNVNTLANLLLEPGRMLPTSLAPDTSANICYQWWPLIKELSKYHREFIPCFLIKITRKLALSSLPASHQRIPVAHAATIKSFLDYVILQVDFFDGSNVFPLRQIIHICLAFPGPYMTSLALDIFRSPYYRECGDAYEYEPLKLLEDWFNVEAPLINRTTTPKNFPDLNIAINQAAEKESETYGTGPYNSAIERDILQVRPIGVGAQE